jgi:hypothetical protein
VPDGNKGDITTSSGGATFTINPGAVTYAKIQNVSATQRVLARKSVGVGTVEECALSDVLDFFSPPPVQGDILYRDTTTWARLPAGVSGQAFVTQGPSANPIWANLTSGAGGVPIGSSIMWNQTTPPLNYLVEDGSALTASAYLLLFNVLVKSSTITMSVGTPAIITWTGNTLINGDPIKFTTTGTLPTGLTVGTVYYVINRSGNTFNLAATPGGAAIATSGTQVGTHTGINAPFGCANDLSTFNLPDSRGEFIRGYDFTRGVDLNRAFGVLQTDAFQGHRHSVSWSPTYAIQAGGSGEGGGSGNTDMAISISITDPITDGVHGTPRSASETRPRNMTKVWCMRYK